MAWGSSDQGERRNCSVPAGLPAVLTAHGGFSRTWTKYWVAVLCQLKDLLCNSFKDTGRLWWLDSLLSGTQAFLVV